MHGTSEVMSACTGDLATRANGDVLVALYRAQTAGDMDQLSQVVADDCVLHIPGRSPIAGDHWGPEGFRHLMTDWSGHVVAVSDVSVTVASVMGDDAFTMETVHGVRPDSPDECRELRIANWYRFRAGKVTEAWVIPTDQPEFDAFWAAPAPTNGSGSTQPGTSHVTLTLESVSTSVGPWQLLCGMYDAFWRGDGDAMSTVMSDQVVIDITHDSDMSGLYIGWDGYLDFRAKLMAMAGSKYKLDVIALVAGDQDVWAVERIRMDRHWDPTVGELLVLMHLEVQDGRITRMDNFPFDPYQWERFYRRPATARAKKNNGWSWNTVR